ncbi:hypothetical protein [Mucilaginibacter sp. dw_454]|uniref:hypothetical protein n=1 Tax=Mucilaginibacter sp. dw_454 TaxID=2720079 RepID=UPI001BD4124A|nr:hypothetical protein [Mucilaginibacter sp. dw_454]
MLLTCLEILVLVGAIVVPLMPRKRKSKAMVKPHHPAAHELSQFVVTENGHLQEISNPHDTSLLN